MQSGHNFYYGATVFSVGRSSMQKALKWLFAVLVLGALMGLSACQTQTLKPKEQKPIELGPKGLQSIVDTAANDVIVPYIEKWHVSSQVLQKNTAQFCQQPNKDRLSLLQNDFKQLYLDWNRVMPFDFGPLRDNLFFPKIHFVESMRQRGRDYSYSIRDNIQRRLADDKVLDEVYFNKLKFTLVGMPAIEILLFDGANNDLLQSYQQQPRKCELLQGMTDLNQRISDYVLQGWLLEQNGKMSFKQRFLRSQLEGGEKPISKVLFAMQDYLRYISQRKLNAKLDAQLSEMSWQNLKAGLEAIEQIYSGGHSNLSIRGYILKAARKQEAKQFDQQLELAQKAIADQDKKALAKAYTALVALLEKPIPLALGLNLGMNFVDGD